MRLCTFVDWTRVVEPLSLLTVLLKAKFIPEGQVKTRRHLKEGPTDIRFALPKTAYYPVDVIYLQDFIKLKVSDVLKNSFVLDTLLKKLYFDLLWFVIVLVYLVKDVF